MNSALDNMQKRLNYSGGKFQQSRMIQDKLRSLKRALLYSYQAGTMVINNPRYNKDATQGIESLKELKFRCLMNPDKISFDADKKILSVPFSDICLNVPRAGKTIDGIIDIPAKCGEVFLWEETNTRWIITLRYLEELAYFRADVRRCYPFPLIINDNEYWFSSVGENQETLDWRVKGYEEWNKLNYTRTLYIKRNEETLDYFKRFKIIKIKNRLGKEESWEVQSVRPNSVDDVLIVHIKEYFENPYEEISKIAQEQIAEQHELNEDLEMYVYGAIRHVTKYVPSAFWEIKNQTDGLKLTMDAAIKDDNTIVEIESMNGKSGSFDLYYNDKLEKHIVVKTF